MQATETERDEYRYVCDVMKEVFNRLNGLIRQLQTMAEMEQKWAHELDDVQEGILQPSAAFFNDFHLQEVTQYNRFVTWKELVGSQWRLEFTHLPLGIFAVKRVLKPVEPFSGHWLSIKSYNLPQSWLQIVHLVAFWSRCKLLPFEVCAESQIFGSTLRFFGLFLRPPWLNRAHSCMVCKISSPCSS